ncbi:MAG TPA: helix-turn-helix transcriptional regulator [Streptosporangiaceae bacterium]|nr:helix-turn-helix transcriptional regulator [Streptosporangiaceae bacterium]
MRSSHYGRILALPDPARRTSRPRGRGRHLRAQDARLTQEQAADLAAISVSLLRKIEQGRRSLTPDVEQALSAVLGPIGQAHSSAAHAHITNALPVLREVMDCYDMPADMPPRSLAEPHAAVTQATTLRLGSRYTELAAQIPGLISELTTAALTSSGHAQLKAYRLLALAYRAADAIADKHGCHDLSARAIELTRWAAARSADPEMDIMAAYVRAELFFGGSRAREGLRVIDSAAGKIPADRCVTRLALYGALQMRASVLAARAGLPDEAAQRMTEARAAASHVPDGVYYGTAFGPSSVHIHQLAAAVEGNRIGNAVQLASRWEPPRSLPAERSSHFYIEAARAYRLAGQSERAVTALISARNTAAQHARSNPAVAQTVNAIIRTSQRPSRALLGLAAWLGGPTSCNTQGVS